MLVIYTSKVTNRIKYTLDFVFTQYFGIVYELSESPVLSGIYEDLCINYSNKSIPSGFNIYQHNLLQEDDIKQQSISVLHEDEMPFFFQAPEGFDLKFDLFSCIFYLLSRYEEYLPHEKDIHGRYSSSNSILAMNEFQFAPIVEIWLESFKEKLLKWNPSLQFKEHHFEYIPTFDIDNAYRYLGRNWLKHPPNIMDANCRNVLLKKQVDPYDVYAALKEQIKTYQLKPVFFFLVSDATKNDSKVSPSSAHLHQLIYELADFETGIHPSYLSLENNTLQVEKELLEKISNKTIVLSRQHFLRISFPHYYRNLLASGIQKDFSLCYPDVSGFRAGCSHPFYFYDLENDSEAALVLQPTCWMDATYVYYQSQKDNNPQANLTTIFNQLLKINGKLVAIFHNDLLVREMFRGIIGFIHQYLKNQGNER